MELYIEIGVLVFVWLLFPNRLSALNLFLLFIGFLTIGIANKYSDFSQPEKWQRKRIEGKIENLDSIIPINAMIRLHDPQRHGDLIQRIVMHNLVNRNFSHEELIFQDYDLLIQQFGTYIFRAPDDIVLRYIKAHLLFIQELYQIDPHLVNQFHYPRYFGFIEVEALLAVKSKSTYFETIGEVIRKARDLKYGPFEYKGSFFHDRYQANFSRIYPDEANILRRVNTVASAAEQIALGKAILRFYEGVTKLAEPEACDIWRRLLNPN